MRRLFVVVWLYRMPEASLATQEGSLKIKSASPTEALAGAGTRLTDVGEVPLQHMCRRKSSETFDGMGTWSLPHGQPSSRVVRNYLPVDES